VLPCSAPTNSFEPLLQEISGVDWTLAAVIIAALGLDMSVFQSVSQLASWAGVCPGNNESAGKRKSTRIPNGNVYLKTALPRQAQQEPSHPQLDSSARTFGLLSDIDTSANRGIARKIIFMAIMGRWRSVLRLLNPAMGRVYALL
jgi:hypothetical protein